MAAYFPSFVRSAMPKRLLRYALSRIDILDDSALDLDNLDVTMGMKSVVELKDVATNVKVKYGFPRIYFAS